ncbi:hypothetical protein CsSME_00011442 [Camellia sinensis var. sinensis]
MNGIHYPLPLPYLLKWRLDLGERYCSMMVFDGVDLKGCGGWMLDGGFEMLVVAIACNRTETS